MKAYDEQFYKDRVNAFPFVKLMGMRLLSSQDGKSVMRCRIRPVLRNSAGTLHGGVMGALVDMSVATALRSVMPLSARMTTVEYKVNFLKPVSEGAITAHGTILRLGSTIAVGATEIRDVLYLPRAGSAEGVCYNQGNEGAGEGPRMTKEGPIRPEMFVGDVLREYPAVRGKIRDLFGAECLQCRSNQKETIIYTSWHRGLDPKTVCRELNEALKAR